MSRSRRGTFAFIVSLCAIAWLWLVCLPRISQWSYVRERIEGNRRAGINPTAVFYTEHPCMNEVERKMMAIVDSPTKSFWRIDLFNDE